MKAKIQAPHLKEEEDTSLVEEAVIEASQEAVTTPLEEGEDPVFIVEKKAMLRLNVESSNTHKA